MHILQRMVSCVYNGKNTGFNHCPVMDYTSVEETGKRDVTPDMSEVYTMENGQPVYHEDKDVRLIKKSNWSLLSLCPTSIALLMAQKAIATRFVALKFCTIHLSTKAVTSVNGIKTGVMKIRWLTSRRQTTKLTMPKVKKSNTKALSYKQMMNAIIKKPPTASEKEKSEKAVQQNVGGGVPSKVDKL